MRGLEVVVEVAPERRRPGEGPTHPAVEGLQFRDRRTRHRREGDVMVGQVNHGAVEAVGNRRTGRTAGRVVRPEHEVIDEKLRATAEEVCERGAPVVGLEAVLLLDRYPWQ